MKRKLQFFAILTATMLGLSMKTNAQPSTTITGTAIIYGSGLNTRTVSRPFTLKINGSTSDQETDAYLDTLQGGGQDALLRQISSKNLGRFSFTGSVGEPLNMVLVEKAGDDTLIRAVFRRWVGFGELRRGLRSADYPFGYVEVRIDPKTGKGEGVIFPAAKVRFRGGDTLEIEDYGTIPGRLMGVRAKYMAGL